MRRIMVEFLERLQADTHGGDLGLIDQFYEKGQRIGETDATKRIVNWLRPHLEPLGFLDVIERHLANGKRCDITACIQTPTGQRMLVFAVKSQWSDELFTAAQCQLSELYTIHPAAEDQGIYLVLWFGADGPVAGKKTHEIKHASDLQKLLESSLPAELIGKIDVLVLDLAKRGRSAKV